MRECRKSYRESALVWAERFPNNPKSHMALNRLETRNHSTGSQKTSSRIKTDENRALSVLGAVPIGTHKIMWMALLLVYANKIEANDNSHHRDKRYLLVYPFLGTFKTVYSFAIPWKLAPKQEMGVGWNIQFQYPMPYNTTSVQTFPDIISRTSRDRRELEETIVSDRAVFYKGVESLLDGLGIHGRECLLRTICENADYTHFDDDSGLLGQILHVFLSPNDKDGPNPELDIAYADAQKAGEYGVDCDSLYTMCNTERSFFNWFSIHGK